VSDWHRQWRKRLERAGPIQAGSLAFHVQQWLATLEARNYSPGSIALRERQMRLFLLWCNERGLSTPAEITVAVVERYQRSLYHQKDERGKRLSFRAQRDRLATLRRFFRWMAKARHVEMSPCETLELPRVEQRLPRGVLTVAQVESVLAVPDVGTPMGIRDRAIVETLYSTGIRRQEICNLTIHDLDLERGTLIVRQGKGKKDRMIPIGQRAVLWITKYVDEVRPLLVSEPDDGVVFLTRNREPFSGYRMAELVRDLIDDAQVGKKGACHLFRHTMATLMLEGGADIRFIQAMLGHARITSTEVYTQVAIAKLKEIHEATHPGAKLERPPAEHIENDQSREELLFSLAAEAAEEEKELATSIHRRRPPTWFIR
jgi:integrase/recombinase XerD